MTLAEILLLPPLAAPRLVKDDATDIYYVIPAGSAGTAAESISPTAAPYDLGSLSGTIALDFTNGAAQKCTLTADATFSVSNGVDGKQLRLFIDQAPPNALLDFAGVSAPVNANGLFPIELASGYMAYILTFSFVGYLTTLTNIEGPFLVD